MNGSKRQLPEECFKANLCSGAILLEVAALRKGSIPLLSPKVRTIHHHIYHVPGPCGSKTEKGVEYVTFSVDYLSTSIAASAAACADFCWELAECRSVNEKISVINGFCCSFFTTTFLMTTIYICLNFGSFRHGH